jgi:hypothetical protein
MWFRNNEKKLDHQHLERMKCLEQGLPLPDAELAWVEATRLRGGQVTAVMIIGTIGLMAAPVGTTAILFALGTRLVGASVILPLLTVLIWSVCGSVLYTLFQNGMRALSRIREPIAQAEGREGVPSKGAGLGADEANRWRIQQGRRGLQESAGADE